MAVNELFVDPAAPSGGTGTEANPFNSLVAARDRLRSEGVAPGGATVWLREGNHHLDSPLSLDAQDSGTADSPITWAAWPGEMPTIGGAQAAALTWQPAADVPGAYVADVGTLRFNSLFIRAADGSERRAVRSRLPGGDSDYLFIDHVDADGVYEASPPLRPDGVPAMAREYSFWAETGDVDPDWYDLQRVEIVNYRRFETQRFRVDRVEGDHVFLNALVITPSRHWGFEYAEAKARYWVENVKEGLAPGSFYLDVPDSQLYYYPLAGEVISQLTFLIPVTRELLNIQGASHLRFDGIDFAHTDWQLRTDFTSYHADSHAGCQAARFFFDAAIVAEDVSDIQLIDCNVRLTGCHGLRLQGSDCVIENSEFANIGAGGLWIGKQAYGGDGSILSDWGTHDITIRDCVIHDIGEIYPNGVAVWSLMGRRIKIIDNEIYNAPYTGISAGFRFSPSDTSARENIIEGNRIHHVMQKLYDGAAIHTLGHQPLTAVRGNCIYDCLYTPHHHITTRQTCGGIYGDEGTGDVTFHGNLIYHCEWGFCARGETRGYEVKYNLFVDTHSTGVTYPDAGVEDEWLPYSSLKSLLFHWNAFYNSDVPVNTLIDPAYLGDEPAGAIRHDENWYYCLSPGPAWNWQALGSDRGWDALSYEQPKLLDEWDGSAAWLLGLDVQQYIKSHLPEPFLPPAIADADKKLIQWGWSTASSYELTLSGNRNLSAIEDRWAFDGLGIEIFKNTSSPMPAGTIGSSRLGNHLMASERLALANYSRDLGAAAQLAGTFQRFDSNFFVLQFNRPGFLWFETLTGGEDDFDYNVLFNIDLIAEAVANCGSYRGLMLDPENYYSPYVWSYLQQKSSWESKYGVGTAPSEEEYRQRAHQAGQDFMAAINAHLPNTPILLTWGWWMACHWSTNDYALLGPFLDGMLFASDAGTTFHECNEWSYDYSEPHQFERPRWQQRELAILEGWSQHPDLYRQKVRVGVGLALNRAARIPRDWYREDAHADPNQHLTVWPWNNSDPQANYFTPDLLERAIRNALAVADEYVWIWNMNAYWYPTSVSPGVPDVYADAVAASRGPAVGVERAWATGPRMIDWSLPTPDPTWIAANRNDVERLPFDGQRIDPHPNGVPRVARETYQNYGQISLVTARPDYRLDLADFSEEIAGWVALKPPVMAENLVRVNTAATGQQWFTNFENTLWNYRQTAAMAHQVGAAGLILDTEYYLWQPFSYCWCKLPHSMISPSYSGLNWHRWSRDVDQSDLRPAVLEDYKRMVRLRGRQIGQAISAGYPGCHLLVTLGYYHAAIAQSSWPEANRIYALLPAFLDGLTEGVDNATTIHDGLELAYDNDTSLKFDQDDQRMVDGITMFSEIPDTILQRWSHGYGLSASLGKNWAVSASWPYGDSPVGSPEAMHWTPATFAWAVQEARSRTGRYVWFWSGLTRFVGDDANVPDEWVEALGGYRQDDDYIWIPGEPSTVYAVAVNDQLLSQTAPLLVRRHPSSPHVLSWQIPDGIPVDGYEIQIASQSHFGPDARTGRSSVVRLVENVLDRSWIVEPPLESGTYWCRVRANFGVSTGRWSAAGVLKVNTPPMAPHTLLVSHS